MADALAVRVAVLMLAAELRGAADDVAEHLGDADSLVPAVAQLAQRMASVAITAEAMSRDTLAYCERAEAALAALRTLQADAERDRRGYVGRLAREVAIAALLRAKTTLSS